MSENTPAAFNTRDAVASLAKQAAAKVRSAKKQQRDTVTRTPMGEATTLESLMTSTKKSPPLAAASAASTATATGLATNKKKHKKTKRKHKKKKKSRPTPLGLGMGFPFNNGGSAAAVLGGGINSVLADACSTPPEVRKIREARNARESAATMKKEQKQEVEEDEEEKEVNAEDATSRVEKEASSTVKTTGKTDFAQTAVAAPAPRSSRKTKKKAEKPKRSARKSATKRKRANVSVSFSGLMNLTLAKEALQATTPPGARLAMAKQVFHERSSAKKTAPSAPPIDQEMPPALELVGSPPPPSFFRQASKTPAATQPTAAPELDTQTATVIATPSQAASTATPRRSTSRRQSRSSRQRRASRRLSGSKQQDRDEMDEAMQELRRAEYLQKKHEEEKARLQSKVVDDKTKEKTRLFLQKKELMKSPSKRAFESKNGIQSVTVSSPTSATHRSPAPIRRRLSGKHMLPLRREKGSPLAPAQSMTPVQNASDAALAAARRQRQEQLCATPGAPANFGGDFSDDSDIEEDEGVATKELQNAAYTGRASPRVTEAIRRNNAASAMQRVVRGHFARIALSRACAERARVAEEAHLSRMEQARLAQATKESNAASKISSLLWTFAQRKKTAAKIAKRDSAAKVMQRAVRGMLASLRAKGIREARAAAQAAEEARRERNERMCVYKWKHLCSSYSRKVKRTSLNAIKQKYDAAQALEQRHASSLSIQTAWRRFFAIKGVASMRAAQYQADAEVTAAESAMAHVPDFYNASMRIENYDEHENGYIVYNISATLPTMGGRVTRAHMSARYSQIDAIDATLRLSGFRGLPAMPPKTWCRNTSLGFLRRRKAQLETYLQGLIQRPDVAQSHEFRYFMRALRA